MFFQNIRNNFVEDKHSCVFVFTSYLHTLKEDLSNEIKKPYVTFLLIVVVLFAAMG